MAGPSMILPGGPLEICFSFDTTISMTSYVDQVKARLQDMVQRLKSDIPGIRIALFAHADYYHFVYDNKNSYVTRHVDFTDDVPKLCDFIKESVTTYGGDWDECYELVMKEARELLTWSPGTNKVLVMIGDARPHDPDDYGECFKGDKIYWKEEVKKLLDTKIRCYGVYCKTPDSLAADKKFFKTLSDMGQGSFLELKNFDSIFDFMMAICYREQGEDALFAYEAEVRRRTGGAAKDVHHMLTTLKKSVSNVSTEGVPKIVKSTTTETRPKGKTAQGRKKTPAAGRRAAANARVKPAQKPAKVTPNTKGKKTIKAKSTTPAKIVYKTTNIKKTAPKRTNQYKALYKAPVFRQQKLRRERVPETNFALRDFPWSSWKILMSSEPRKGLIPTITKVGKKDKITEYSRGYQIFTGKTRQPALYEMAVRPLGSRQKKIVFAKICPNFSSYTTHWSKMLIPSKSLRKQIDNIIQKQGGDIYVRRLILKKYPKYEKIPSVLKNYDYVWAPQDGAKKYRELKKDSYVICEEMDVN